ncbi:unnamed protein product [Urochloa humidicola]
MLCNALPLKSLVAAPSIQEVEHALDALQQLHLTPAQEAALEELPSLAAQLESSSDHGAQQEREAQLHEARGPPLHSGPAQQAPEHNGPPMAAPGMAQQEPAAAPGPAQPESEAAPTQARATAPEPAIEDFFVAPEPPALQPPPQRRQRKRRTFDMSAVCRSARLSAKPTMPAVQRAQRNLWRKLGLDKEEYGSIEELLQDYINMYEGGPLPEHIVAAMTAAFDLDDIDSDPVHEALLEHAGNAVDDLQPDAGLVA